MAAHQIRHHWALSSQDTCIAVLDNDETSGSADVAMHHLRLALHQAGGGWGGTHYLPGIGAAAKSTMEKIVLIDDFIGTGNKTKEKIEWIRNNEIKMHDIYVLTFVGQYRSRHMVGSVAKSYYACHWGWKGISDEYLPDLAREKIRLMLEIEGRFRTISPIDQLGRGRAESTFFPVGTNTPNNVFPIFWKDRHKGNPGFRPLLIRSPKK
jgi:hypothetical protein